MRIIGSFSYFFSSVVEDVVELLNFCKRPHPLNRKDEIDDPARRRPSFHLILTLGWLVDDWVYLVVNVDILDVFSINY